MEMVIMGHFAHFDQHKNKKSILSYYMDLKLTWQENKMHQYI